MTRRPNPERNKKIVHLKDKGKLSFREIAKLLNLAVSSVHEAYSKKKGGVRLSTGE